MGCEKRLHFGAGDPPRGVPGPSGRTSFPHAKTAILGSKMGSKMGDFWPVFCVRERCCPSGNGGPSGPPPSRTQKPRFLGVFGPSAQKLEHALKSHTWRCKSRFLGGRAKRGDFWAPLRPFCSRPHPPWRGLTGCCRPHPSLPAWAPKCEEEGRFLGPPVPKWRFLAAGALNRHFWCRMAGKAASPVAFSRPYAPKVAILALSARRATFGGRREADGRPLGGGVWRRQSGSLPFRILLRHTPARRAGKSGPRQRAHFLGGLWQLLRVGPTDTFFTKRRYVSRLLPVWMRY